MAASQDRTDADRRRALDRVRLTGAANSAVHELAQVRSRIVELGLRTRRCNAQDQQLMAQLTSRAKVLEADLHALRAQLTDNPVNTERRPDGEKKNGHQIFVIG